MSNEFEKWPARFQKPGEEEEDHTLRIEMRPGILPRRKKLKRKGGEASGNRQDERK